MDETKERFIERYCRGSKITREFFNENFVALPCKCEDGGGPTHWAAVDNAPYHIIDHVHREDLSASEFISLYDSSATL